jgi:UDP-N-acetyl-D-glucosamine dehydrogenase
LLGRLSAVIGFDLDEARLATLTRGASYLSHFTDARVAAMRERGFSSRPARRMSWPAPTRC